MTQENRDADDSSGKGLLSQYYRNVKEGLVVDWENMVLPSLFTKTFGRTLMVAGFIRYHSFSSFVLQNLMYAAPWIALMSGTVVFFYKLYTHYKESNDNGKPSFMDAAKKALSAATRTAVKFFVVYMGWSSAVGLVTSLNWFAATAFFWPALVVSLSCIAGFGSLYFLKKYLSQSKNGKSDSLTTVINIAMIILLFAGLTAMAYFINPFTAGLLAIGGLTALALLFASILVDVLLLPPQSEEKSIKQEKSIEKLMERPYKMLSRAYSEGVIWTLIEHAAIFTIMGTPLFAVLDVFSVTTLVCLSISFGGLCDTTARFVSAHTSQLLSKLEAFGSSAADKLKALAKKPDELFQSTGPSPALN